MILLRFLFLAAAAGATLFALAPQQFSPSLGVSDPVTHGLAFFALAALAALAFSETSLWRIWTGLALLGGVIELLQAIPVLQRGHSFSEWLVDVLAAGLALSCVYIGTRRCRTTATVS